VPEIRWYSVEEVAKLLGIGRRTLFTYVSEGRVPEPVRFTARTTRWNEVTIGPILREGPRPKGTFKPQPKPEELAPPAPEQHQAEPEPAAQPAPKKSRTPRKSSKEKQT
jgi:predicted DNA-binding transcriptional regulator AlpA